MFKVKENIIPNWVKEGNYPIEPDKFYTNCDISKHCVDVMKKIIPNWNEYKFVEPSAGNGSFLNHLPKNTIAMDILPENDNIICMDYFDWEPTENEKYITIGNPPFGVRGWYALEFINKAATYSDYVCFILPMYFASDGKGSAKYRVKGLELIYNEELPSNIFTSDNVDVNLNTVFQIWKKGKNIKYVEPKLTSVDIYTVCSYPKRVCGMDKLNKYDCFLASTYYGEYKGVVFSFDDVKYGSGYGIIINDKDKKDEIIKYLMETNWNDYNINATNKCKHIGKKHIKDRLINGGFF